MDRAFVPPDFESDLLTERLTVEPMQPWHAPLLYEQHADERMWSYEPPSHRAGSVADLERRFARYASRTSPDGTEVWLNYAVRLTGGAYVGTMQATIAGKSAWIGYSIFADHWRRGYGKEACERLVRFLFHDCGVQRIRATVDAENEASIALLEGLGFRRTWTGPSGDMPGRRDHRYERRS
jgi:RimJ/RimL family protein N-acetyltransferase